MISVRDPGSLKRDWLLQRIKPFAEKFQRVIF